MPQQEPGKLRFSQRLSVVQARVTVIVALVLGLIVSLVQIYSDLVREDARIDREVSHYLSALEGPAAQAAYALDPPLGQEVLTGALVYAPVIMARIDDNFGEELAILERPDALPSAPVLASAMVGEQRAFSRDLFVDAYDKSVGKLTVVVAPHVIAEDFFSRAGWIVASGLVRNALLAGVLLVVFYVTLGRPLARAASALSMLGKPGSPEQLHIPKRHTEDELGQLLAAFNEALEQRGVAVEERRMLEGRLLHSQRVEAVGQLASGIAHDFNNILASVLGHASLAERYLKTHPDEDMQRYLREIRFAGERAQGLVGQLLSFSRSHKAEHEAVDLPQLVEQSVQMLKPTLPASFRIEANVPAKCAPVVGDAVQLHQVLINLCINARDACAGKGVLRLAVREARYEAATCISCHAPFSGDFIELMVGDDGPGMSPETLARCFEPFFTTKPVGRGTGMGLATVHGIVHGFGGHLLVESTTSGTTFRALFPLDTEFRPTSPAPLDDDGTTQMMAGTEDGACILVVDDEAALAGFIVELLGVEGYNVVSEVNPAKALDYYKANSAQIDLVITDSAMPEMSGEQFAHELRELTPDVPIILCTGFSQEYAELDDRPFDALLRKPVPDSLLLETVARLADGRNSSPMSGA